MKVEVNVDDLEYAKSIILDEEFEIRRWTTTRRIIIQLEGKFLEFFREEGNTEEQWLSEDQAYHEFNPETRTVTCYEVTPRQITSVIFERKK